MGFPFMCMDFFSDFIVTFEHNDVVLTRCFGVLNGSRVSKKRGITQIPIGEKEGSSKRRNSQHL